MGIFDLSMTAGMRSNVLMLKDTGAKIERTQERLATGKKVNSALDNPTNYFTAQSHLNRISDLNGRKDSVKEAIQNISAANNGITSINSLLGAAAGIADAALSTSDETARTALSRQFDEILNQLDTIATDSGYRGTNLLKSQSLTVNFGEAAGQSTLTIAGMNATSAGLGVDKTNTAVGSVTVGTGASIEMIPVETPSFTYSGSSLNVGDPFTFTIDNSGNPHNTPTTLEDTVITPVALLNVNAVETESLAETDISFSGDSKSMSITILSLTSPIATGDTVQFYFYPDDTQRERTFGTDNTAAELSNITVDGTLMAAGTDYNLITRASDGKADIVFTIGHEPADGATVTADATTGGNNWISTDAIQTSLDQIRTATDSMRSNAKNLASTSTILLTRMIFTDNLTGILQTGADNLTLADMNEEGATMLMLQTRQSMGTTSLSLAGQSSQSVMKLFL